MLAMSGMNAATGKTITGIEHLRQSVLDILSTPVGTRVMRRDYGSRLPYLVDAPLNGRVLMAIIAESAGAVRRWEPRLKVKRVQVDELRDGYVRISMDAIYKPFGNLIRISGVEAMRA